MWNSIYSRQLATLASCFVVQNSVFVQILHAHEKITYDITYPFTLRVLVRRALIYGALFGMEFKIEACS